jgi:hypothetical protein
MLTADLLDFLPPPSSPSFPLSATLPRISHRAILDIMSLARTRTAHVPRAWFSPTSVAYSVARRAVTYEMSGRIAYAADVSFRRFLTFWARGDKVLFKGGSEDGS